MATAGVSFYATVMLKRNGRTSELNISQVNVENLRRVFQVDPGEAWLQDDISGTAYFPNEDGSFTGLNSFQTLIVNGAPSSSSPHGMFVASSHGSAQTSTLSSTPSVSKLPAPQFRSVVLSASKKSTHRLKVIKATLTWQGKKPVFTSDMSGYIDLQESTANVENVLSEVRKKWGSSYIIVNNDGLQIEDSSATQGLAFWKAPRINIWAVLKQSLRGNSQQLHYAGTLDSDDEFEPRNKRIHLIEKMNVLTDEVSGLKEIVSDIMKLTKDSEIPLGLKKTVGDTFKCKICHTSPIKPPIIISKCCKSLLGCES
jgi:hypothetical protein